MNVGDVIEEKYELTRLLGEGGMGTVYEARHLRLGRKVALKFLKANLAKNPEAASRFLREARAAATIGSEHVVDVMDVSQTAEGEPYLVMEFLEGEDLRRIIEREGPFAPARAARLTIQLCHALAAAHSKGIIHRDVKPENMMIERRYDGTERLRVLDFGLVKFKLAVAGETAKLTASGATLGTPYYMAPEQAMGEKNLDHRVDIYSAGVVLFQMLTTAMPFDGETYAEILVKAATKPPLRPRQVRPDLPEALEAIVLRAISREPGERFQTAAELAQAVAPWTADAAPSGMAMAPTMLPGTMAPTSTAPGFGGVTPPAPSPQTMGAAAPHLATGGFTPAGSGFLSPTLDSAPAFAPTMTPAMVQPAAQGYGSALNPMQTAPPVTLGAPRPSRSLRTAGLVAAALLFVALCAVGAWFAFDLGGDGPEVAQAPVAPSLPPVTSGPQATSPQQLPGDPAAAATASPLVNSTVDPAATSDAPGEPAPAALDPGDQDDNGRATPRNRRDRLDEPRSDPSEPAAPPPPQPAPEPEPAPAPTELPFPTAPTAPTAPRPAPQPAPQPTPQVLAPQTLAPQPAPEPAAAPRGYDAARNLARARDWAGCVRELGGATSGNPGALRVRCYHEMGNRTQACAIAAQCSDGYCRRYLRTCQ